jgi:fermentation-respiration switch protein FrsA (DUF1100 family)
MVREQSVRFYAEGDEVVATLFLPANTKERCPAVAFAPGYIAVKEMVYGSAKDLASEGYVALAFDYRGGPGESLYRGKPNPPGVVTLFPDAAVWDLRSAFRYLQSRDEVDPARICLFGSSAGGAYVVAAAAAEPGIAGVISEGGIGNGYRWARMARTPWQFRSYLKKIEEDKRRRVATGKSQPIPNNEFMVFNPDETQAWVNIAKQFPKMAQHALSTPLEVCERWLEFKPEDVVARIAPRPILFIGEEASDLVPPEEVPLFYERAAQPKTLVMAPAAIVPSRYNKFDWANEGRYIPWMWNHMAGWLREHLPARG